MARSTPLILCALVFVLVHGPMATADDDGVEPTRHVRWSDGAENGPTVLRFDETPGGGCRGGGSIHMAGADANVPRSMEFVATGGHPCEFTVTAYEDGVPAESGGSADDARNEANEQARQERRDSAYRTLLEGHGERV